MCGICGIVYTDPNQPVDERLLTAMTRIIQHRGPDDEGLYRAGGVGLGSRRLAIVGLGQDSHMPMASADGGLWIVYNGELYNHPELKRNLQSRGCRYRTASDTETYLHLYRQYGDTFLERARGMFALALWDAPRRRLILARDRLGIKPLYYHFDGKALRFGSEIKSILLDPEVPRGIDLEALNYFLAYFSAPEPLTMFQGIRQLGAGEMLIFQDGNITIRPFWNPKETIRPLTEVDEQDIQRELADRLKNVVREHLLSDVPVGAFLSGGIDSSILVALMHDHLGPGFKSFAIGFEGHRLFDETPYARTIARQFGTEHYEKRLAPRDLLTALEDITWQLDEPLADSSCLPVYFVSRLAAGHVKVVLSGDGGDEVFAGYRKYQAEYYRRFFAFLPESWQRFLSRTLVAGIPESRANVAMDFLRQIKKFFRGLDPDPFARHLKWGIHFEDEIRAPLLRDEVREAMAFDGPCRLRRDLFDEMPDWDDLNRMLWVDLRHTLAADMLRKVDRMSMLHSLEVRVPFLDHTLVEFGFSLPARLKLRGKTTKWILKQAFADCLPPEIIRRRKHGFDVPVGEWFKKELRALINDVASPETVARRGLFNPRRVQEIIKDHQDGKRDYNNHLWILLSLELWQRRYLDCPPGSVPDRPCVRESP